MKYLSDLDSTPVKDKIAAMTTLVYSYSKWIDQLKDMIKDTNQVAPKYYEKANKHIAACQEACERMYSGLELLNQETIWQAFQLANRAMFMQRIHLKLQEHDKYPNDIELQNKIKSLDYYSENDVHMWRPFQIAFLLMSIQSIIDPACHQRDIVDLIWFPTGGGKTEAYLGLTAFTIFYRRLAYSANSGGTACITRYTLRLLAAQQFVRAATLICACEAIRQDASSPKKYPIYPLGKEMISIGLWIGGDHTPNKTIGIQGAKEHLEKLHQIKSAHELRWTKDRHHCCPAKR